MFKTDKYFTKKFYLFILLRHYFKSCDIFYKRISIKKTTNKSTKKKKKNEYRLI